jgi:hypothetical protein
MNPFRNSIDPFGVPGDAMEEVLSLQAYGEEEVGDSFAAPTEIITHGCVVTNTCPPPKTTP